MTGPTSTSTTSSSPATSQTTRFDIRSLDSQALHQCPPLSADRFGFTPTDQVPPWLIQTFATYGGIALGAFQGNHLIGYSICFPGQDDGQRFLFSCGLAVERAEESSGVGMALKLAQRERAVAAGYEAIRWTTTSVASRQLYLYLNKLGARLIRMRADMYAATLGLPFPDEVEIEWRLTDAGQAREPHPTPTVLPRLEAATQIAGDGDDPRAYLVEIPWDRDELLAADPSEAASWSRAVGTTISRLVDAGYVGITVQLDRPQRRSFVQFERHRPTSDRLRPVGRDDNPHQEAL